MTENKSWLYTSPGIWSRSIQFQEDWLGVAFHVRRSNFLTLVSDQAFTDEVIQWTSNAPAVLLWETHLKLGSFSSGLGRLESESGGTAAHRGEITLQNIIDETVMYTQRSEVFHNCALVDHDKCYFHVTHPRLANKSTTETNIRPT
jgi:hypothetical protein